MVRTFTTYALAVIALLTLGGGSAFAARILKVSVDQKVLLVEHPKKRDWQMSERVCFYTKKKKKTGCGRVVRLYGKHAKVKILILKGSLKRGYYVRKFRKKKSQIATATFPVSGRPLALNREPQLLARDDLVDSGKSQATVKEPSGPSILNMVTGGASVGLNHLFPFLHYQRAFLHYWTFGVAPFYLSSSQGTDSVGALGCYLTANFYPYERFRGLWLQGALGLISYSAETALAKESATSFAVQVLAGWRHHWDSGLNLGAGAALQYVTAPKMEIIDLEYSGIEGAVILEVGWMF